MFKTKRVKKIVISLTAALVTVILMNHCELPYDAEITDKLNILTIDGSIAMGNDIQKFILTKSTKLHDPEENPYTGCAVYVVDENGKTFDFIEGKPGIYTCAVPEEDIVLGRAYMGRVITPEGEVYESEYEILEAGAPVDTVYFEKDLINVGKEDEMEGLRFYIDLKGEEGDSRYYRWQLTETWQYNSKARVDYIYTSRFVKEYPEDHMALYSCWHTFLVPGLFTSSTKNLETNEKKNIPLHFLPPNTGRLGVKYSLLIEQYSLSEEAFEFWNQSKVESEETGGLYYQQPGQTQSNFFNTTNPDDMVLGYFWVAAKTEKRIFIKPFAEFYDPGPYCYHIFYRNYRDEGYPVYITTDEDGNEYTYTNQGCLDCRLKGGSSIKPEYWE